MTTDERPERTQDESGHTKRRTKTLTRLGVGFCVAAALSFLVVWMSMKPSEDDLSSNAWKQVDREMSKRFQSGERETLLQSVVRENKHDEYYKPMLAQAQGLQREAATKAMLVPAAAAVLCFVLGYVSSRARLIAAGIVLLGLTAVYATFLVVKKNVGESEAALYILVIAVAGLSGLVCTILGMVRFLATSKGA